jgi:hypothetical protein
MGENNMQRKFWLWILVVAILMTSKVVGAEVTNCTAIPSLPYTITTPGIYCFTQSLSTSTHGIDAITVGANDVVIEMNGRTLEHLGGAGNSSMGIRALNRTNVTVRNGTIRGFHIGVSLWGFLPLTSQGYVVEGIHAEGNHTAAMEVAGLRSIVRDNRLTRTGESSPCCNSRIALWAFGAGLNITNNKILETTNAYAGIYVQIANGAVIEGNVVSNSAVPSGPTSYGIVTTNNSFNVIVAGNRITNMKTGIELQSGGLYIGNTVGGATTPFSGGTAAGSTNFSF